MKEIEELRALARYQDQLKIQTLAHNKMQQIKEAERNAVEKKYQKYAFIGMTPISVIEKEISKAQFVDLQTIIGNGIASKLNDVFIGQPSGGSHDWVFLGTFKPEVNQIPGLFDDMQSMRNKLKSPNAEIQIWATKIRAASTLAEADSLCSQMKEFHRKNFSLIKFEMNEVPVKMVEKINKVLNPAPVNINPPSNSTSQAVEEGNESEVQKLLRTIAELKIKNKELIRDKADLAEDKKYWKSKANKKDVKVKQLKQQLNQQNNEGPDNDESSENDNDQGHHQSIVDLDIDIAVTGNYIVNN